MTKFSAGPVLARPLEMWAGIECTVNRVQDSWFDQIERNGHAHRPEDLEMIAGLGIKTLRYPLLWERTAPEAPDKFDWSWNDERLTRLRELDINPIAGLVHHGSGPHYTSLIDPEFPEKLADYARAVATRYPWLTLYTPVNEPLTTARFSGLYGHWYPHGRDDATFAKCLLNECKGTVLAMWAIHEINPQAQLVQTEDLGKTYSTPLLQYQADLENERRWLSFDLLCGRLNPEHPMWDYLMRAGVSPDELRWFADNPCPPDLIGINHYLTSDRYLDENMANYPSEFHGGNGRHAYADEAAIRVQPADYTGHRGLLKDAWDRYHIAVAVTEAHLGCTREEQLRWLFETRRAALQLREEGIPVKAVTAWSVLGAFDWNVLVTAENGFYEPGVFDLRGGLPRPTAIAHMLEQLTQGCEFHHPVLDMPGWWQRPDRFWYPQRIPCASHAVPLNPEESQNCDLSGLCNTTAIRPVMIIGANGTLGKAFSRICDIRGIPYYLMSRRDLNISEPGQVEEILSRVRPWAVINAAGYVRVDEAENEREACWRDNVTGPVNLAKACADLQIPLVTFSSDLVFGGSLKKPYLESHPVNPLNVYGQSKAESEKQVLSVFPEALIIRTSAFFGPWDAHNFVTIALRQLLAGQRFSAAEDMFVSPTYVPDLVNAALDLLIDGEHGLWHLSNHTEISWAELARMAARLKQLNPALVDAMPAQNLAYTAKRPIYSVLGTERCRIMPDLENAMARYIGEVQIA